MNLVLLGYPDTERSEYFLKAAGELGVKVRFVKGPSFATEGEESCPAEDFDFSQLENSFAKVDPPLLNCHIESMNSVMGSYCGFLQKLSSVPGLRLLNSSDAIKDTLDKVVCKKKLQKAGLSVTPFLAGERDFAGIVSESQLKELMLKKKRYQVFVKPRFGSGSAGVIAYRLNPKTGKSIIETSASLKDGRLINTRKLRKISDPALVDGIISRVFGSGAIVETWIPKASYNGKTYDLRAVFQFGRIEYMVARKSGGPVTNLHLNNDALPVEDLALGPGFMAELETLCRKAALLFPGLNVAGFDILLEKEGRKPRIIEINGQGDLIYMDILAENRIYKAQIRAMKNFN